MEFHHFSEGIENVTVVIEFRGWISSLESNEPRSLVTKTKTHHTHPTDEKGQVTTERLKLTRKYWKILKSFQY